MGYPVLEHAKCHPDVGCVVQVLRCVEVGRVTIRAWNLPQRAVEGVRSLTGRNRPFLCWKRTSCFLTKKNVRIILIDDSFEKGDHCRGPTATSTLYLA